MVPHLLSTLRSILAPLACEYEIVFVNDGSKDATLQLLVDAAASDYRIKVVGLSRNFGQQIAITAGLDMACGDAVIVMDADLQDPPDLIPRMLELYEQGYDVVSPQRVSREQDGVLKRATARGFYWVMKRIDPRFLPEVGDFRLLSSAALTVIRQYRERHRFLRGLIASMGLKEAVIPFDRKSRIAGQTKYPMSKMLKFAWTAITSFSGLPLRLVMGMGFILTALAFLGTLYVLYSALVLHDVVPGWTSMIVVQTIFSGAILISVGVVGDYVSRIYEEMKGRPLYIVNEAVNLDEVEQPRRCVVLTRPRSGIGVSGR
jgi:dolichol-phosphate mannosyltransferase